MTSPLKLHAVPRHEVPKEPGKLRRVLNRITGYAPLKNLVQMPLTVAGAASIDVGVFTANPVAGWIVTGLTLIGLEYLIADDAA